MYTLGSDIPLILQGAQSQSTRPKTNIFDTIIKVAGTVQQAATGAREITAGNARVTVVPTAQGVQYHAGQFASQNLSTMMLIGGGALVAILIATSGKKSRRRR